MADIRIESGVATTRTFTIKDVNDLPIDLNGKTVVCRWRRSDHKGDAPVVRSAEITSSSGGKVSVTFLPTDVWQFDATYDLKFIVTPAPNGTNGRFPDGYALTLQASRKV